MGPPWYVRDVVVATVCLGIQKGASVGLRREGISDGGDDESRDCIQPRRSCGSSPMTLFGLESGQ